MKFYITLISSLLIKNRIVSFLVRGGLKSFIGWLGRGVQKLWYLARINFLYIQPLNFPRFSLTIKINILEVLKSICIIDGHNMFLHGHSRRIFDFYGEIWDVEVTLRELLWLWYANDVTKRSLSTKNDTNFWQAS